MIQECHQKSRLYLSDFTTLYHPYDFMVTKRLLLLKPLSPHFRKKKGRPIRFPLFIRRHSFPKTLHLCPTDFHLLLTGRSSTLAVRKARKVRTQPESGKLKQQGRSGSVIAIELASQQHLSKLCKLLFNITVFVGFCYYKSNKYTLFL